MPPAETLPVSLSYEIEDESDFRQKKSGTSLNITVPATPANSRSMNTLFNAGRSRSDQGCYGLY